MLRVPIVIEHQIRMPALAFQPSLNFFMLLLQRSTNGEFGHIAIGIRRSGGDVALMFQPLPQLLVTAAYVLPQDMSASRLVLGKIASRPGE
jgi:hypothetical protein